MLNDDDIVRVTVNQELAGVDIKNVFFYLIEVLVAGSTLLDVLADFRDNVWTFIRALQVSDIETLTLVGENLTNGIDIDSLTIGANGTDATGGSVQPSYVAAGYRFNVLDKTTRPGGKRFAGIGESRVIENAYNPDATANTIAIGALAYTFPIIGVPTGTGDAIPIVVGRNLDGSLDLTRFSRVSSVDDSLTIRTQTSRRVAAL